MRLWCYGVDHGGWGQQLHDEAVKHGIDARMFVVPHAEMREGDYAFMRIPQWEPECSEAKKHAKALRNTGVILIPDYFTIISYEDKLLQTLAYRDFMPKTHILRTGMDSEQDAKRAIEDLGLPFLSKSRVASSSVNVRMVVNMNEAIEEYEAAIAPFGHGISMNIGRGREGWQTGYLIWQKFCEGNSGDIRVCINGKHALMLWRDNAHGSPFASGSGKNHPVNDPDDFQIGALRKAMEFFAAYKLKWTGIDLVYDFQEHSWRVLETTLGWSAKAYENCTYFGTDYKGRDVWKLFCEQLLEGVFG